MLEVLLIFRILTIVLKTVETAIFDWLLLIGTMLEKFELDISYVSTEEVEGIGKIFFFSLMIVVYLPSTVKAIKAFRDAEPTDGIFA